MLFYGEQATLALNCLMVIMAIVELVVSIWSAVLCCGAVCRCCKSHSAVVMVQGAPGQLPYPQQQFIMHPGAVSGQQFTGHVQQTACKCLLYSSKETFSPLVFKKQSTKTWFPYNSARCLTMYVHQWTQTITAFATKACKVATKLHMFNFCECLQGLCRDMLRLWSIEINNARKKKIFCLPKKNEQSRKQKK